MKNNKGFIYIILILLMCANWILQIIPPNPAFAISMVVIFALASRKE
jgi:hypothetical protein